MRARSVSAMLVIIVSIAAVVVAFQRGFTSAATERDSLALGQNRLSAARLDLAITGATRTFAVTDLAPGDRAVLTLTLTNAGTLPMLVALRTVGDGSPLAAALDLGAWTAASCEQAPSAPQSRVVRATGTTPVALLGDVAPGRQDGDIALPAGGEVVVCIEATLGIDAGNELQRASTSPTLLFDAEHDLRTTDAPR